MCKTNSVCTLKNLLAKSLKAAGLINSFEIIKNVHLLDKQGISCNMYSFSIVSINKNVQKNFILRIYQRKNIENAIKEFKLLNLLKAYGAPVPVAYYFEKNNDVLNQPIMILEEINGKQASEFFNSDLSARKTIDKMAEALVSIHAINLIKFDFLTKNRYSFELKEKKLLHLFFLIKRTPTFLFFFSSFYVKRFVKSLKKIDFLTHNKKHLVLLHMDYDPENVILTNSKCVIVDWSEASVGDPAYDVAWTYHMLAIADKEHRDLAHYFVNSYKKYSNFQLKNLNYYKDIVALNLASYYGLCPFGHAKDSIIFLNLVDQIFGNIFGRFSKRLHLQKLKTIRTVKNKPESVWDDIEDVQQYFLQYFETMEKK